MAQEGRLYDRLSITTADRRELTLYFDITAFVDEAIKPPAALHG